MFEQFTIFLPAATCATWLAIAVLSGPKAGHKTGFKRSFVALMFLLFVFYMMEGIYCAEDVNHRALANAYLVAQFVVPSVVPAAFSLFHKVSDRETPTGFHALLLVFPFVLVLICMIVRFLMGTDGLVAFHRAYDLAGSYPDAFDDRIFKVYYNTTIVAFFSIVTIEVFATLIYMCVEMARTEFSFKTLYAFLFGGKRMQYRHLVQISYVLFPILMLPRALVPRLYLIEHIYIEYIFCVLSAVLVTVFSYLLLFSTRLTRDSGTMVPETPQPDAGSAPQATSARMGMSPAMTASLVMNEAEDDSLLSRFENLMFKDQAFLKPGLTILDVAEALNTNKTYISRLVNQNYFMPFPDFVNSLRIDYAEQYILHHTAAKQKDIAEACGFPSASALNNTFKKITGLTPKVWLANHGK